MRGGGRTRRPRETDSGMTTNQPTKQPANTSTADALSGLLVKSWIQEEQEDAENRNDNARQPGEAGGDDDETKMVAAEPAAAGKEEKKANKQKKKKKATARKALQQDTELSNEAVQAMLEDASAITLPRITPAQRLEAERAAAAANNIISNVPALPSLKSKQAGEAVKMSVATPGLHPNLLALFARHAVPVPHSAQDEIEVQRSSGGVESGFLFLCLLVPRAQADVSAIAQPINPTEARNTPRIPSSRTLISRATTSLLPPTTTSTTTSSNRRRSTTTTPRSEALRNWT